MPPPVQSRKLCWCYVQVLLNYINRLVITDQPRLFFCCGYISQWNSVTVTHRYPALTSLSSSPINFTGIDGGSRGIFQSFLTCPIYSSLFCVLSPRIHHILPKISDGPAAMRYFPSSVTLREFPTTATRLTARPRLHLPRSVYLRGSRSRYSTGMWWPDYSLCWKLFPWFIKSQWGSNSPL